MIARAKAGDARPGSIVNISSDAGVRGTMGQINYGTAKSGILGMTMSAAREWARFDIRVNCVAFGVVETQMTETLRGEKFRDTYLARIPLARSEEHTSELQSLMRISYSAFCCKKDTTTT